MNTRLLEDQPESRIAYHRKKLGLSQARLAEMIGVHEVTIANWEHGRKGYETIQRAAYLCDILHCTMTDLLEKGLRQLREEHNLSRRKLAQFIQVRENTIASWENDPARFEWIEKVARLCVSLRVVSPKELLHSMPPINDLSKKKVLDRNEILLELKQLQAE